MLSFQRKSLSFESALSYLQAFHRNSHAFLWKRSSLFQHFNSLCEVNGVLLHFLNALLSEKITLFETALIYLQAFTRNSHAFFWKRSSLFQHFNSLCVVNGVLLPFLFALLLEKITLFWKCLKLLTSIHKKLISVSLKEKQSDPTLQFTVRSDWSVPSHSKCCPSEKITLLWTCLKLLSSIHKKLTSFFLKEKQSVPTLQFTVRCEWSVASLSKCSPFRENHSLWNCLKLLKSMHKKLTSVSLKEKQSVPTLQFTVRSEWSVASLSKCCPFRENHFPLKVP